LKINDTISDIVLIGPYLLESNPVDYTHIIEFNNLSPEVIPRLEGFYQQLPKFKNFYSFGNELLTLLDFYYPNSLYRLNTLNTVDYYENLSDIQPGFYPEEDITVEKIEAIYEKEDLLLKAVHAGNYTEAFKIINSFSATSSPGVFESDIKNYQHYLMVQNALYRKEVQNAHVHPMHIDMLSRSFTQQIEKSTTITELTKTSHDMLRKYCLAVQNHSLQGHTKVIRDALNYIEFHLVDDLSLKAISSAIKISPNYLSNQFSKEMYQTLTDYVNTKRIEKSLLLITTTDMLIQDIAASVGISDESYFSRLFKKKYGVTASQYRKNLTEK
jgi:YesN/AraC family two-component response regulator